MITFKGIVDQSVVSDLVYLCQCKKKLFDRLDAWADLVIVSEE